MYSTNANNGQMTLKVNFDVKTDTSIDQVLFVHAARAGGVPAPGGSAAITRDGSEVHRLPDWSCSPSTPERDLRQHLPGQLRQYQHQRPDDAGVRGFASVSVFGAGQYAMRLLGEAGPAGQAQRNDPRDRQRHQRAEQGEPRRAGRRGPVPKGQEFTYARPRAGRLETEEEFAGSSPRHPGRLDPPPEGRGPRRTRRADVQPERPPQREAGGTDRPLPDAGHQRHRSRTGHPGSLWRI